MHLWFNKTKKAMEQGDNAGLIYNYQGLISIESKCRKNANKITFFWKNAVKMK